MKYRFLSVLLLSILLVSLPAYAINFTAEDTYNSVVVVYTGSGVGSGFAIEENIIVTNAHVVEDSKNVAVTLYNGDTIEGLVIKTDETQDLALIQVDETLVPLKVSEEKPAIGQEVYAIGAPRDMPYTMTKGIISALDRKLGKNSYIQIDASINSGNSGGPLVDENGNVIGIITLKATDAEGIGFAIAASEMLSFTKDAEEVPFTPSTEAPPQDDTTQADDTDLEKLTRENEALKIAVIVLSVFLIACILVILKLRAKPARKDEFDFEIEIEE